jgi:uncharacterized iron-regulated protein
MRPRCSANLSAYLCATSPTINLRLAAIVFLTALTACATPPPTRLPLTSLLPADAVLLGEQHDAPDHQRIHREVITDLAVQGLLAAVVIEMAERGTSTAGLERTASEAQVRSALRWNEPGWHWANYGPAVMAAVRQGVPILGANLPRPSMTAAMADTSFDRLLRGPALKAQQQLIRTGHCGLLPESQITPMTRIQIARDVAMAETLTSAAVPGKTVVLLAGSGHVDRVLGVPQHLPEVLKTKAVLLLAGSADEAGDRVAKFDLVWTTASLPEKDYCADFKR